MWTRNSLDFQVIASGYIKFEFKRFTFMWYIF